ncbi:MAG TPA: DMT family transporter [Steroidobacteraceae bacterium]|nr:DMT family transporter [Steroidobacteraceae bacterium]
MIAVAPRDLALLIGITLIWGINLITNKIGVEEFPPILFTALRFIFLAIPLTGFLRIHRGQMGALSVAALLTGALQFALLLAGLAQVASVSSVAIAGQLGVPFTTLLSIALLGEEVRWRRWTGVLLSFGGIVVMGFDPNIGRDWFGLGLVVASAFVGSLGVIAVKKLYGFRAFEIQAWFGWISGPVLLAVSLASEHPTWDTLRQASTHAWSALAFTAFGASMFAHTGYFHLVRRYPVTSVAPVTTLSPVFSVLISVLWLGEKLTPRLVLGGICTLIGVLIITLRERRIIDTGS